MARIPNSPDRPVNVDNIHTILGPESSFEGKLSFEGTVRVDGVFKGEIHTEDVLVIGEGARVEAEVKVGSIIVNGEVRGNVTATSAVELHAPGKLYGNITTPQLTIDKGVLFEGSCTMTTKASAHSAPAPAKDQSKDQDKATKA